MTVVRVNPTRRLSLTSIHGLALSARDVGGRGLPFVFEHGIGADDEQTFQVLPDTPGIRPVTLNLPGHGGSELGDVEDISITRFADLLAAFIDRRFGGKVLLGGISMGAAGALNLAVRRPDLGLGLVLVRPGWRSEAAPDNTAPLAEVGRLLELHDAATARLRFLEGPIAQRLAAEAPRSLKSLLQIFDRTPRAQTAALLTRIAVGSPGVSDQEIAAVTLPTLVVATEGEAVHPTAVARWLAERIPAARLVTVPSKSVDRSGYLRGMQGALGRFFQDFG